MHVHTEPDGRVSYRPYREASAALLQLLRSGLPPPFGASIGVVERASIDEAYIKVSVVSSYNARDADVRGNNDKGLDTMPRPGRPWSYPLAAWAADVANAVRRTALQQLGLVVSVGVAPNKVCYLACAALHVLQNSTITPLNVVVF